MLALLEAEKEAHHATTEQAETATHIARVQIASYSALEAEKTVALAAVEVKLVAAGAAAVAVAVADAVAVGSLMQRSKRGCCERMLLH